MSALAQLSIKTKLSLLIAVIAVSSLVVLVVSIFELGLVHTSFAQYDEVGVEVRAGTLRIARDTNYVSRLARSIMLGDNYDKNMKSLDEHIGKINKSFEEITAAADKLGDAGKRAELQELIKNAAADTKAFVEDGRSRMSQLNGADKATTVAAWDGYHATATPLANKSRESFGKLQDFSNAYIDEAREGTNNALGTLLKSMLVIAAVAVTLSIVIGALIARSILLPLRSAMQVASRVASGDLATPITANRSKDEASQVLASLADMQVQLRNLVGGINNDADRVAASASEVSGAAGQIASSASQQSDAASAIASSIEEMTASVGNLSESAAEANRLAEQSQNLSSQGGAIIEKAARDMIGISSTVQETANVIKSLGEKSAEISTVVTTIKDIADQTNLLALNAAIEAARAGEQGRGFAVVADEVRKLAERTAQSTSTISEMVATIQSGAQDAVQQIETSVEEVKTGVAQAEQAGQSIRQIKDSSSQVLNVISTISNALREQSAASNEIARRVEHIAKMAEENSSTVRGASASANGMEDLARSLKQSIGSFRT